MQSVSRGHSALYVNGMCWLYS